MNTIPTQPNLYMTIQAASKKFLVNGVSGGRLDYIVCSWCFLNQEQIMLEQTWQSAVQHQPRPGQGPGEGAPQQHATTYYPMYSMHTDNTVADQYQIYTSAYWEHPVTY